MCSFTVCAQQSLDSCGELANPCSTVAGVCAGSVPTCKSFARASPRASPKWHPGGGLQDRPDIIHPTFRLEDVGILEVALVAVHAWIHRSPHKSDMLCLCRGSVGLHGVTMPHCAHGAASQARTGIVLGCARATEVVISHSPYMLMWIQVPLRMTWFPSCRQASRTEVRCEFCSVSACC